MESVATERRAGGQRIAIGVAALATIPIVGAVAASYHIIVGIVVTTIYGAAALAAGTAYIATGIADRVRARPARPQLPAARIVKGP